MSGSTRGIRLLAATVALALMLFSVGFSWAVVDDYAVRRIVPRGATVACVDVGGMPRDAAVATVRSKVVEPLLAPLHYEIHGKDFKLDPRALVKVDVEGMVDRTFTEQDKATLLRRVYRRISNEVVAVAVPADVKLDTKGLKAWIATTSKDVYTRPVDSKLTVDGDRLHISASHVGWRIDEAKALVVLRRTLSGVQRESQLPLAPIKPAKTEGSFGRTLLARIGERHVYLFDGARRIKDYPIAVGMDAHPTPPGWWHIVEKQHDPVWTNPGSAWAAGMPSMIPAGPGNPMGTRAILLDAAGVAFHGTANDASVGTAASHGCMRMHEWDVHDLFDRVQVGDRVIIAP
jgi:lipoprotein-anchoring transpeptidase ErfK/SrfK